MSTAQRIPPPLPEEDAAVYADWFACLAEPTRVRLLHAVAVAPGGLTVGALTEQLGVSQSTCSHHVRRLADLGFLSLHKHGTATRVTINQECCTGLPHAADAVMGLLSPRPCCPADVPADVTVRAPEPGDRTALRTLDAEAEKSGAESGAAISGPDGTGGTVPDGGASDGAWLAGHRWVAEIDGEVVGWTALRPVSAAECYAGVAESAIYVGESFRCRGVGTVLLRKQVEAADRAGLWTLQTSVFTGDRAGVALHHAAGYRTVGVRQRIALLGGVWHDTVLLERRVA
ncbi:helix-turn-helix domain-containing GNAT family N-acetyltransferase [Saccharomonospora saliphila]|uniref:helix-turn-helix domain-containing GNAT family N-acetyltransferase n=1 Tax=Saccharomonospora saliphila TaxID=369829 RepID=UPI000376ADD2|nr:GNAT family N-acetyltransferase [Saccharomonospora saliphila]